MYQSFLEAGNPLTALVYTNADSSIGESECSADGKLTRQAVTAVRIQCVSSVGLSQSVTK